MGARLFVTGFQPLLPAHSVPQAQTLAWLVEAHTRSAGAAARGEQAPFDETSFRERVTKRLARFGCGADKITARGLELGDCTHQDWSSMRLYSLVEGPRGAGMLARTRFYAEATGGVFDRLYAEVGEPPADLVHVTCTGYASPSAAQRLLARKGWGGRTQVTHAYHMGCYAAFPALRIASGLALAKSSFRSAAAARADIVHTELCSLHLNPQDDTAEQLVVQTLFADGFIRYAVCDEASLEHAGAPSFEILSLHEALVPDSEAAMAWVCSEWGMKMTLARDVPERLGAALRPFVATLLAKAGVPAGDRGPRMAYAIHPGGPRILDQVRDLLELTEPQVGASRKVLAARGNMSSATLPHVWADLARAPEVPPGTVVVSLAFGPGLTMSGAVFQKVAA